MKSYETIEELLIAPEGEHYEFKAARTDMDFQEALKYCCALANCGGGKLILGITDRRPRKVVGSAAFNQPERTINDLMEKLIINALFHEQKLSGNLRSCTRKLINMGVIESTGRDKYVLARGLYAVTGKSGVHTRLVGLDRETNKELILKHIRKNGDEGTPLKELQQVLPGHSRGQVQVLLRELRKEKKVFVEGNTNAAKWYISTT